jgi:hypothetical protein
LKYTITGLDLFGLRLPDLSRLGTTRVRVYVHLKTYDVTPSLVARKPGARHEFLRARVDRWIKRLEFRFPHANFQSAYNTSPPTSLLARLPANRVLALSRQPGVRAVHVASIAGHSRSRTREKREWYCVRGRVSIQVENRDRGMQTVEDRFVLVRADSFDDAERRLARHWREYAHPYLNRDGLLVRWHLEEITGVYATWESELDPKGVEVYSKLHQRRATASRAWRPRRKAPSARV